MKYKLKELAQIQYGKDHKKLKNGNIPVLGTGGLMRYGDNYLFEGDSVLIPRKGSLNNIQFATGKFWTVDTLFWTKIDVEQVIPKYLFYVLKRFDFAQMNVGSAVPSLTTALLNELEVEIPDINIQQSILDKINPFESQITNLSEINDNLAAIVEMIYQKMLLTQNAEDMLPLSKLFTTKSGFAFKSKDWSDTGIPVIKIKDINGKTIDTSGLSYVENVEALTKASKFHVSGGETVIALTGATTGKIGVVPNKLDAYINQRVGLTTPSNSDIHSSLIWSVFLQSDVINGLIGLADGSAQANLSPTDINNFEIAIATQRISEFQIIADPLFESYIANLSEISILANLRDELLTELLS